MSGCCTCGQPHDHVCDEWLPPDPTIEPPRRRLWPLLFVLGVVAAVAVGVPAVLSRYTHYPASFFPSTSPPYFAIAPPGTTDSAALPPTATAAPAPSATVAPSDTPSPTPTAAPSPTSTPPPAPAVTPDNWSPGYAVTMPPADRQTLCGWGAAMLGSDALHDEADAAAYPAQATYYQGTAATWTAMRTEVLGWCGLTGPTTAPTEQECGDGLDALEAGLASHVIDAASAQPLNPPDFDAAWEQTYTQLIQLWREAC